LEVLLENASKSNSIIIIHHTRTESETFLTMGNTINNPVYNL